MKMHEDDMHKVHVAEDTVYQQCWMALITTELATRTQCVGAVIITAVSVSVL